MPEIDRDAIEATVAEFDRLGRMQFLQQYGYGEATTYLLRHRGRFYDPKAIVGVAHKYTDNAVALRHTELDATEAIARLGKLGFEVLPFNGLWWVNQGATYRAERDGGFVWAPQRTKAGRGVTHHTDVNRLRVGQLVIHYANNNIRALGTVAAAPYSAPKPEALSSDAWQEEGFLCPVDYRELDTPIHRQDIPRPAALPSGPFDSNGGIKQGYLFSVPSEFQFELLEFLSQRVPDLFSNTVTHEHYSEPTETVPSVMASHNPIIEALLAFKNVALEGVPGTGKSHAVHRVASEWHAHTGRRLLRFADDADFRAVVLHPSSSYEDFVEGLRPQTVEHDASRLTFDQSPTYSGTFGIADGFFVSVCAAALAAPDQDVLVLLDELNRCNVPSVFGDLLLTLEKSRRARYLPGDRRWSAPAPVRLPYSGRSFFVPENVYVIATMNTTDRSVAPLDAALRRRFAFCRLEPAMPDADILSPSVSHAARDMFGQSSQILRDLNDHALRPCLGPDAMLGHSYLYAIASSVAESRDDRSSLQRLKMQWQYAILPQLIDSVRALGAEDLLSPGTRKTWFEQHSELVHEVGTAQSALDQLDSFLHRSLDLRITVEGIGLSRGARVERYPSDADLPGEQPMTQDMLDAELFK